MHISYFLHCIILSSLVCLAVPIFPTLFHKQYNFLKKDTEQRMLCVFIFSTIFVYNISLSENNFARHYKCT